MRRVFIKTPEEVQEETAGVIKRVFRAPPPWKSAVGILASSFLFGFVMDGFSPSLVWSSLIVFALPALLSALLTIPTAISLKGIIYPRRSFLLSLLALLLMGPCIFVWRIVTSLNYELGNEMKTSVVLFSLAFGLWLRHITLVTTSKRSHLLSLPSSAIQPIIGGVIALWYFGYEIRDVYIGISIFVIFGLMAYSFIRMVNTPLQRAFSVDGVSMAGQLLNHIGRKEEGDVGEVESFFESISSPVDAHVGIVSFRRGERIKALVVVPSVHPGPFGYIGGSNLPAKLASDLRDATPNVLVPHGPSTHDYNPSSRKECKKISFLVSDLLSSVRYTSESSGMVRMRVGDANACAQMFGNSAMVVASLAPLPTDDLDFPTGYAAIEEGKKRGLEECLVIDAHNSLERGSGHVHFGSRRSREVIEAVGKAVEKAKESKTKGIKLGVASASGFSVDRDGLGERGIQAVVLETGGRRFGYILYDGNNMVSGLRERILERLREHLEDAEVLTTDNHSVNATMGGFNPVGWKMNHEDLIRMSEKVVRRALDNLEDVEVGMKTGWIHNFNIFGHQSATRLASVINSTIHSLRWIAFTNLLIAVSLSALVFMYFF